MAWLLYAAGCFGSSDDLSAEKPEPTPVATSTPERLLSETAIDTKPEQAFEYTIEEGDTISKIAAKFLTTEAVIVRANPGISNELLFIGDVIKVPGATVNRDAVPDDPTDRKPGQSTIHVVSEGQNMGTIAEDYLVSLDALTEANPDVVPHQIQIGQILEVPPIGTGLPPEVIAARSTPVPVQRNPGEILWYTVQPGDSLSAIADFYGVTEQQILDSNLDLDNRDQIKVAQELLIPPPPTAAPTVTPVAVAPAVPQETAEPTEPTE